MSVRAYNAATGYTFLRGDLARKLGKQLAAAVELLHSLNIVHGDITSHNVLFQLSDEVFKWSDDDVYQNLGEPWIDDMLLANNKPPGPSAPLKLVEPILAKEFVPFLKEDAILIDFGTSFHDDNEQITLCPPLHYCSPGMIFETKFSPASDIWALACTLFEIRAEFSLISSSIFQDKNIILTQILGFLGPLPEPWWRIWERWYDERTGEPKPIEDRNILEGAPQKSFRERILDIRQNVLPSEVVLSPLYEKAEMKIEDAEVDLLLDLLTKMMKYNPEERITMKEVHNHPWFHYN